MRIEITAIVSDSICNDDHDRSWSWQQATYTIDGVPGPGVLSRYLDDSEEPRYTDDQEWNVRHDARCVVAGDKPELRYPGPGGDDHDDEVTAAEDEILAAWERFDKKHLS